MKCMECELENGGLHNDPRQPPLDTEPCLCFQCLGAATEDRIEELKIEIEGLKRYLSYF